MAPASHRSVTKGSPGLHIKIQSCRNDHIQLGIILEIVIRENQLTITSELNRIRAIESNWELFQELPLRIIPL